jgi:hypothetical protein
VLSQVEGRQMGWWRRVEETLWTGKVIKDYGVILQDRQGIVNRKMSVILAEGNGGRGRRLYIRTSAHAWLSASVSFLDFDRDAALKLRTALDDALTFLS